MSTKKVALAFGCGAALLLIGGAYVLRADAPPVMPVVFTGKFALIEPQNGAWITVENPQARTVGSQSFIIGTVPENSPAGPPSQHAGSLVWIPAEDVKLLWEFRSADQFVKARERYQTEIRKHHANRGAEESP